jgi:hypothetical protein
VRHDHETNSRVPLISACSAALFDDAMADNSPLFKTISRYVNEAMLAELAKGYDDGRLLLIGTSGIQLKVPIR